MVRALRVRGDLVQDEDRVRTRSRWRGASRRSRGRCRSRRARGSRSSPRAPAGSRASAPAPRRRDRRSCGRTPPRWARAARNRARRPWSRSSRCRTRGRRPGAPPRSPARAAAPSSAGPGRARSARKRRVETSRRGELSEEVLERTRPEAHLRRVDGAAHRLEDELLRRRSGSSRLIPFRARKARKCSRTRRERVTPPVSSTRGRRAARLHEDLGALRDGVEEPGQDTVLPLALVREVRHVGLEDDRAPAGERRGLADALGDLRRLLDGQVEAPDELPEEVAGPLRAAGALAILRLTRRRDLQDADAAAADRDDRRGLVAVQEAKPA